MNDQQILSQFHQRSEDAICAAKQHYGAYCRSIALRILNDEADAEEVLNDVLLKAWNTIPPQMPASLRSYLGMLSRQIYIDRWRSRPGEFSLSLDELRDVVSDRCADRTPDALALRDALNGFLRRLRPTDRRIFLQRYWYACSIAQIAELAGLRESAVKMRLKRARDKLRDELQRKELL